LNLSDTKIVGRFVKEAAQVFETRVQSCQQRNEDHLHVYSPSPPKSSSALTQYRIVGKGIHSQDHMAKLRPEIEKLCQQHQFKYFVEENEGRILVKFGEGPGQMTQSEAATFWNHRPSDMPPSQQDYPSGPSQQPYQQQQDPQQQYQSGQQPYQGDGGGRNDMVEEVVKEAAPVLFKKLMACCTIL
jgi:hypothetical protein